MISIILFLHFLLFLTIMNSFSKLLLNEIMFEDDDESATIVAVLNCDERVYRSSSLYRKRWDSEYLVNLAVQEGSFTAEYRLSPSLREFDTLNMILCRSLETNQDMAKIAMSQCGSRPISTASRIGAALIMLSGGRKVEAMRTHGLSKSFVHDNLLTVCKAINNCPVFDLDYSINNWNSTNNWNLLFY